MGTVGVRTSTLHDRPQPALPAISAVPRCIGVREDRAHQQASYAVAIGAGATFTAAWLAASAGSESRADLGDGGFKSFAAWAFERVRVVARLHTLDSNEESFSAAVRAKRPDECIRFVRSRMLGGFDAPLLRSRAHLS